MTPPLPNPDWFDQVAVDEVVAGRRIPRSLTPPEQAAAGRALLARGESASVACRRIRASAERLHQLLALYPERKAHR